MITLLLLLLGVFLVFALFSFGKLTTTLVIGSLLFFLIAVGRLPQSSREAQEISAQAGCIEIKQAVLSYQVAHGAPPASLAVLGNADPRNGNEAWIDADRLLDPWHRPFVMSLENGKIRVISYGADGKPGGTGLDADIGEEGPVDAGR
jgi:general secretion pathway protein G